MTVGNAAFELQKAIKDQSATIAVIGLGYVGLPLCRAVVKAGFQVVGFDTDVTKIEKLACGENYILHIGGDVAGELKASGRFTPTATPDDLRDADVIILCVPTPLGSHDDPDLTYVRQSAEMIAKILRKGQIVILESTTYPGTTRDEVLPILETSGLKCGSDFFLAYSPEREDPGSESHGISDVPRVVGGIDDMSAQLAEAFYSRIAPNVFRVSSTEVAEASKLLENIFRAVNIALVNELKVLFSEMGIDIWEVIAASSTKPFGFQPFYPGPGLGGHCIPIDPFYLAWKAKEIGKETKFIELAGEINRRMPEYVVGKVIAALSELNKPLRECKVLVIGIAYKPDVDDIRETPAAPIIERLQKHGVTVNYHDPHISVFPKMKKYKIDLKSISLTSESIREHDCILIVTNHKAVDYNLLAKHARLIIDTRNAMEHSGMSKARIIKT